MLDATLRALARLRASEAHSLGQGLGPENAKACMNQAIRPFNADSLQQALVLAQPLPRSIAIVVPYGVFTTPIEWTALALAGGSKVHLKAPARDPAMVRKMVQIFSDEGLPITGDGQRSLPPVDAIAAFGDDETVDAIQRRHPNTPFAGYGHRFSVAFVSGDLDVAARCLASDVARYDTRGCMAPTAVFTTGDAVALCERLATEMVQCEARWPRGAVDPALGPEWRRRIGLARVTGRVWSHSGWSVTLSPASGFVPMALPRMINVHAIEDAEAFDLFFQPWRQWLSTCGTDLPNHKPAGFHRVCALGWMQAPPFPRNHDGRPMLSGLHRAPGGANA